MVGGILTFMNGRLNEANTPELRVKLWSIVFNVAFIVCAGLGTIAAYFSMYYLSGFFLVAPNIWIIFDFYRSKKSVNRRTVLNLIGAASLISIAIASIPLWSIVNRMITLHENQVRVSEGLEKQIIEIKSELSKYKP